MTDWGEEENVLQPMPKRRGNPEWSPHVAIKRYIEAVIPNALVFWIRNEVIFPKYIGDDGHKRAAYITKLKAGGFRPGMPDLGICLEDGATFFMEVKPPTRGRVSEDQKRIHGQLRALGHQVAVVRSIDEARAALVAWGIKTRDATT